MTTILEEDGKSAPWKAFSWRFTAFFKEQTDIPEGERAFLDFFERAHEETVGKPAEMINFFRLLSPAGVFEVALSPLKIDFKINAVAKVRTNPEKNEADFDRGTCEESYESFRRGVDRFMDSVANLNLTRLAVGVELGEHVSSREEGYTVLGQRLMSLKPDASVSSDLSYQINYPRTKTFGETTVLINRLSSWSVVKAIVDLQQEGMDQITVEMYHSLALLDLNTTPTIDVSVLTQNHRMELVNTLFEYALEIAERGESL